MADGTARSSSGGGNSLKPSHNQDFSLIEAFNNLAPWGENKFISKLKRTYKFQRGVNNILDCHANQTRILSKEYSFVAGDYVRSTARNDVKLHTEDNSPKYRMVGKMISTLRSFAIAQDDKYLNRLRNKCAMSCDLFPRPFGERVRERGYLATSLLSRLAAFTLAEVLITLGIIGVVAALTMPTLINNINKKHWIAGYKKAYSELSQIHQLLNSETGGSYMVECGDFDDVCLKNLFAEKVKVIESCKGDIPNKCQGKSTFLDGSTWNQASGRVNINDNQWPSIVTASGYSVKFRFHGNDCSENIDGFSGKLTTCGWMQVDVNGLKKPNVVGKDIYLINIYKNKLVPFSLNNADEETLKEDCLHGIGVGCSTIYLYE